MESEAMAIVNEIEKDILMRIGLGDFWRCEVEPEIRSEIKARWAEIIEQVTFLNSGRT